MQADHHPFTQPILTECVGRPSPDALAHRDHLCTPSVTPCNRPTLPRVQANCHRLFKSTHSWVALCYRLSHPSITESPSSHPNQPMPLKKHSDFLKHHKAGCIQKEQVQVTNMEYYKMSFSNQDPKSPTIFLPSLAGSTRCSKPQLDRSLRLP